MPEYKVSARYIGDLSIIGFTPEGGYVLMSSRDNLKAPSPVQLLLLSLAGCTSVDIAAYLENRGVYNYSLEVTVEGERRKTHPKTFKWVRVTYRVRIGEEYRKMVMEAVDLSWNKLCSVLETIRQVADVERSIIFVQ